MEKITEERHIYMKYIWKKREVMSVKWQLKKACEGVINLSVTNLFAYVFVGKTLLGLWKEKLLPA